MARSFFGPVVRPARGGVSGFASASRPKAAPQETQDRHGRRKGQAWDIGQPPPGQASDRHSSRVRSPFGHQTGLPMPRSPDVRGCLPGIRSLDADRASPSWLRLSSHAGSRGTGNPSTTTQSGRHRTGMGQASDRHSSRVRSPFGHQTGLPMPRSPDVRGCLPGIRSLDADRASPSWLRLSSHAGSRGTGNPSTTAPLRDVPAPNTPRSGGPRPPVRATLGVARDGPSENGQDARVSRRQRAQNPAVWRTAVRPSGQPLALPATGQAKTGRMPVFRV